MKYTSPAIDCNFLGKLGTPLRLAAMLGLLCTAGTSNVSAASVTFVGKANDTIHGSVATAQANFRSTDVPKTYDIDGNDIYGTDGYKFWATSTIPGTLTSLPAYITSITPVGTSGSGVGQWNAAGPGFGPMDDPSQPPGAGVANLNAGVLFKKCYCSGALHPGHGHYRAGRGCHVPHRRRADQRRPPERTATHPRRRRRGHPATG